MIILPNYLQCDQRWGSKSLGGSSMTLCSDGCAVTSLTMALNNWGVNLTPDEVETKVRARGGFENGKMYWTVIPQVFPQLHFHYRWDTTNNLEGKHQKMNPDAALEKINRLIELGQPVLLNVNHGTHWVVAYKRKGLIINDPLHPLPTTFESRYGDPLKTLSGFAILIGPPLEVDEDGDSRTGIALWKAVKDYPKSEVVNQLL